MKRFWERVEEANRRFIPPALVVLLVIILIEILSVEKSHWLEFTIKTMDYTILFIFVLDLCFLAKKSKNARFFFKNYWIDIIAVFPFSLIFNFVERAYLSAAVAERLLLSQEIVHESLETEKIVAKESRLVRIIRIVPRSLRVVSKSRLFTKFSRKLRKKHRKK